MGDPFDKFTFVRAVMDDPTLTHAQILLAIATAVRFTRRNGIGWSVELTELAAAVPGGLSANRVRAALGVLVARGWLVETGRSGGGRGVVAKRSFALRFPYIPPPPAGGVSSDTGDKPSPPTVGVTEETPTASGSNPHRQRLKPPPPAVKKVTSELREQPPKGTSEGTSEGVCGAGAREVDSTHTPTVPPDEEIIEAELVGPKSVVDPRPPAHCPEHLPYGTTDSCPGCMRARKMVEAWERRNPGAEWQEVMDLLAARAEAQRSEPADTEDVGPAPCRWCHGGGYVLSGSGQPVRGPMVCHHNGSWHKLEADVGAAT